MTNTAPATKAWVRPRHRFVLAVMKCLLLPLICRRYGVTADAFPAQKERPHLILINHQTAFDQFFVMASCPRPVYFLGSEDLFSNGLLSKLMRFLIAPIPIRKQMRDVSALRNCMRVAKEGGSLCIAPEGNRTYSGRTGHIGASIVPLVKHLRLPLALYRIEGGFGVQPRFSDGLRKGSMRAYVARVLPPEEYLAMSDEALLAVIRETLSVNEDTRDGRFLSSKRAEYLERAAYVCPDCGFAVFESAGNIVRCTACQKEVLYNEDKTLSGQGFDFPFATFADWFAYQEAFVTKLDPMAHIECPLFCDRARLYEEILYEHKVLLRKDAQLSLYGDRIAIDEGGAQALVLPFADVDAATVLGRNKLALFAGKKVYQIKGKKGFNALKYVQLFHHYKNHVKGITDGEFLGF